MPDAFDLLVVGTGTAATVAAARVRAAGWRVAVIDHRPFGGTCPLRGCDPKRVLMAATEAVDRARSLAGRGVEPGGLEVDWTALMAFKRGFTTPVPAERERRFAELGIAMFHGSASFAGRNELAVDGRTLTGERVLIAAGAEAVTLGVPGEEHLATSEQFLDLDRLPRRIVFVGGGYIGFELAHVAQRAGAAAVILERGSHVLDPFDPDLVARLVAKSRALGIDVRTDAPVTAVECTVGAYRVRTGGRGSGASLEADLVVHSGGRGPALRGLRLEAAGVAVANGRIELNEYLQSRSNPAVYAAGDSAQAGPPLTPVAAYDGQIAARNILEGNRVRSDYSAVPSVVFTGPPLAAVGASERQAREDGLVFRTEHALTGDWYTNRRLGEDAAGYKLLVEEGSGRILGAHLLGPGAEETINVFALAMRAGLRAAELKETFFAYPTASSDIGSML